MPDCDFGVRKRDVDPKVVQVALMLVMRRRLDDDATARDLGAELLEAGRKLSDSSSRAGEGSM